MTKCRTIKVNKRTGFFTPLEHQILFVVCLGCYAFHSLFVSIVLGFFLPFVFVLAHAPDGLQVAAVGAFFMPNLKNRPFLLIKRISNNSNLIRVKLELFCLSILA